METSEKPQNLFAHGARWFRVDFHLHTNADKEFKFKGDVNYFVRDYLDRLSAQDIGLGVITNHNKFDIKQFKELRKLASSRGIFLLPGVELSVRDGARGIHCLIVFDADGWLANGQDYINRFLDAAFEHGVKDRENENARCNYDIKNLLDKLSVYSGEGRDSFIILAHVEDPCGFCNELEGGRITEFAQMANFRRFVLGFQKFRSRDLLGKVSGWFGGQMPALVEGSDCKGLEEVGRAHQEKGIEKRTYIKLSAFTFEGVKYALLAHHARIASQVPERKFAHIKSLSIVTGRYPDGLEIRFNADMNNLIGIRGSGKSTFLEILRYGLGIDLSDERTDGEYKDGLIDYHVGSGGEVHIEVCGRNGEVYRVERIYNEQPKVFIDGTLRPHLVPSGIVDVLYFGQKDLAQLGEREYQKDLLNQLFREAVNVHRKSIEDQGGKVKAVVGELKELDKALAKKKGIEEEIAKIEERLRFFKKHRVQEKLERQIAFVEDLAKAEEIEQSFLAYQRDLQTLFDEQEGTFLVLADHKSKENNELFAKVFAEIGRRSNFLKRIQHEIAAVDQAVREVSALKDALAKKKSALDADFAEIKRQIQRQNLNADVFLQESNKLSRLKAQLGDLQKKSVVRGKKEGELAAALTGLQKSWHEEFKSLRAACDGLNEKQLPIRLELEYRGDKQDFVRHLSQIVKGTGIQQKTLEVIAADFADAIEIHRALASEKARQKLEPVFGSPKAWASFQQRVTDTAFEFLTYKVPNKPRFVYKDKEFTLHSMGQRASALMLFILGREKEELLIIDQPEDDLDNQSIYEEVIKKLVQQKGHTQFIFATHNPNIPVLGESEQVIACELDGKAFIIREGGLDDRAIQNHIITIMEGGRDALKKRQEIYQLWQAATKPKR